MHDIEVITDPAAAVVALDPSRSRLLAELRVPASAAELAGRIGVARQKINYHVRQLEAHGLVEVAESRTWGGLTERRLVATAAGYVISPSALGSAGGGPERVRDRLSVSYLIALAARLIRELGELSPVAVRRRSRLPVYGLDTAVRFATPADRAAFAAELTSAVTRLAARYHDESAGGGRWQRLMISIHPVPAGVDAAAAEEAQGRGSSDDR